MTDPAEQREGVLERWRVWRAWRPSTSLTDAARRRARRHCPNGWPGFPPPPPDLTPPPDDWLAAILEAYQEYDQLNARHFGDLCPPVKIEVNPRLRVTAGVIHTDRRILQLNAYRLAQLPEARIETVFHEMIHLWLYTQGLPAGHNSVFRRKMTERGHRSVRYGVEGDPKGPRHTYPGSDRWVLYRCPQCGGAYRRRRRYSRPMLCGTCLQEGRGRHRIVLVGVESGNDRR